MVTAIERGIINPYPARGEPKSWRMHDLEVLPQLSEERVRNQIRASLTTILSLQNPITGLTSAATHERRDDKQHMGCWWMRDQAIKALALSNGVRDVGEEPVGGSINHFVQHSVDGMLELLNKDAWQEGFNLDIRINPYTGIRELSDSKKAPPIHARTNGDLDPPNAGEASWVAQNQPDAWGFLFQVVARSVKNGIVVLDNNQQVLIEQAVSYIDRIQPENLRQTSMWEWTEPGIPPTSSVAIVGKGLFEIYPLLQDPLLKKRVERRIQRCREYVARNYPQDYTAEFGHPNPVDLATLVAMGHDALDGTSYSKFLTQASKDLTGNNFPGMIRYRGDQYHLNRGEENGEAAWFMGLPYRANLFFKSAERVLGKGQRVVARRFYAKGAMDMNRALDIVDEYGYPPELFEFKGGKYEVPMDGSSSHIGWNDAILIQAGAQALKLKRQLETA